MDLFTSQTPENLPGTPLAEKMRPKDRKQLLGQEKVLSQIQRYVSSGNLPSLILWGPPGSGKTTLAQSLASEFKAEFVAINATESGVKTLKEIGEQARFKRLQYQTQTILFVDEIHRFNKSQQDVLLPFIEKGELILIGATTENPSYELNRALLSRCRLLVFERHTKESLKKLVENALQKFAASSIEKFLKPEALDHLLIWADGDARRLLLGIEEILSISEASEPLNSQDLTTLLGKTPIGYDRKSDQHYDVISAFIKSIRGSDADAALYYLARMLKGGEDPVFIARRLVILSSEDIGNADPRALQVAVSGLQAVELVGMPEGAINLSQVVTYLASAPKSNSSYVALKKAQDYVEKSGTPEVPSHLKSSQLSKDGNYIYPHDFPRHWVQQSYWPQNENPAVFYEPSGIGFEKQIKEYLAWLKGQKPS
jgi:putative ATPase